MKKIRIRKFQIFKMKNIKLTLLFFGLMAFTFSSCKKDSVTADNSHFYLDDNGVTVRCEDAAFGSKGKVNGKTYTKRDRDDITPENAASSCTRGITDMSNLFFQQSEFNEDISHWDVSNVTWMAGMFASATSFNQPLDHWDVRKVTSMSSLFNGAAAFNQDIGNWETNSLTACDLTFNGAAAFNKDIGSWNVGKVTNMYSMFSRSGFNQNIGNWDVGNVESMIEMFKENGVFNQDLSGWCVTKITDAPEGFIEEGQLDAGKLPLWGECP